MKDTPICPCENFEHPQVISNPPGRDTIAYRVGDYTTFRHALLLPLKDTQGQPQETELQNWNPSATGDLALQLVEWWAYLADILTFYNERIANQSYLRTADLPESVQRLIRPPWLPAPPWDRGDRCGGGSDEQSDAVYIAAGIPAAE